jgi:hypothetical protein
MATSGSTSFDLEIDEIIQDAYERSINYVLQEEV